MTDGRFADSFVIATAVKFKGEAVAIEIVYPFDFPDEAPTVFGPPDLLDRHQHSTSGNFCLLENSDADWWPGWPAAHLVTNTLTKLLGDTEQGRDAVTAGEADMPEPVSAHIAYGSGAVLVPDPFWEFELDVVHGDIKLVQGARDEQLVLTEAQGVGAIDPELHERLVGQKAKQHRGVWVALAESPPPASSGPDLLRLVDEAVPESLDRLRRVLRSEKKRRAIESWLGVSFPEEGPQRGQVRRAWVFLRVALGRDGTKSVQRTVRVQALSPAERLRRLPELSGLDDASVAVIGAGSLGSPVALELAKAGVGRVAVGDWDTFDVNNAVRHAVGVSWAGIAKTVAVASEAQARNPFIEVTPLHLHVGAGQGDSDRLDSLLESVDLVVDTTGSLAVARILNRRCREAGKRLVIAGLSAGSFGGEVIVLRPDGPCFMCFALAQREGTIPVPSEGPRSNVTPVGCAHPAFSGAGFDATELAAVVARAATQATYMTSYPALDYDWSIINFRGAPRWQHGLLERHPECPVCQT